MKHIVLFATLLILTGTACKKSKKEVVITVTSETLSGNWTDLTSSLWKQAAYTFNTDLSYTWFAGGTSAEETGTYQLRATSTPDIYELRFTKTGTTTPYTRFLKKIDAKTIRVTSTDNINDHYRYFFLPL